MSSQIHDRRHQSCDQETIATPTASAVTQQRKRRPAPTVTARAPKPVAPVTAPDNAIVTAATLTAALSLAICSDAVWQ